MTPSSSDRIAICGNLFPFSIKQQLLFFDRIAIFGVDSTVKFLHAADQLGTALRDKLATDRDLPDFVSLVNDLEFLQSKNIVFEAPKFRFEAPDGSPFLYLPYRPDDEDLDETANEDGFDENVYAHTSEDFDDVLSLFDFQWQLANNREDDYDFDIDPAISNLLSCVSDFKFTMEFSSARFAFTSRIAARYMQRHEGLEASAVQPKLLAAIRKEPESLQVQRPLTNVVDVVLDKLPMPSEQTPWEAILDFKADTEAQGYLQGLKVWMGEVARQKLTANEARDKLDWLLFQHQKHLKVHKLSVRRGILGSTFVAGAEILGNLADLTTTLKWVKSAVGAAVSISDRKLELMKAELSNPAKEITYIVKAQEQFGE
jgi:hypothetical protein